MSLLSVLIYIVRGKHLRRGFSLRYPGDADYLELVFRILAGAEKCPEQLSASLEEGIKFEWVDVYDSVNPYGDRRGRQFESVWTFDLENDVLLLTKGGKRFSVPLRLARERLLSLDDFEEMSTSEETVSDDHALPVPHWEPELESIPREDQFLGKVLRDFLHVWRHVTRRQMKTTTFMKLPYAVIWISKLEFTLLERTGFEHITSGGPYIKVWDLPGWETPETTVIPAGSRSTWFVLAQDLREGLEMVRNHLKSEPSFIRSPTNEVIYTILTLRHVILCKASGDALISTKAEKLFDGTPASDAAIDIIIWTANATRAPPQTKFHRLPIEIQNKILHQAATSLVASAKLGCELGLGSPFCWVEKGAKISILTHKTHRSEESPVESQIVLNGVISGLSYKREMGYGLPHFHKPLA